MPPPVPEELSRTIETLYRSESDRVLATLVRLLGDLDLAEEAMHEAFAAALESWPQTVSRPLMRCCPPLTSTASAQDTPRYSFSGPEPETDRKLPLTTSGLPVTRE